MITMSVTVTDELHVNGLRNRIGDDAARLQARHLLNEQRPSGGGGLAHAHAPRAPSRSRLAEPESSYDGDHPVSR